MSVNKLVSNVALLILAFPTSVFSRYLGSASRLTQVCPTPVLLRSALSSIFFQNYTRLLHLQRHSPHPLWNQVISFCYVCLQMWLSFPSSPGSIKGLFQKDPDCSLGFTYIISQKAKPTFFRYMCGGVTLFSPLCWGQGGGYLLTL